MSKKKDTLVKKSNSLVRSSWVMDSIWEARLVALVASKTRVGDVEFKEHEIPISEILEGAEIQRSGQIYYIIEKAAKGLIRKIITIREPSGATIIAGVFAQCRIDPGTGIIKVAFAPALRPHYLQLKEKFTQYALEEFMQLPSTYSQRIFEILMSWKNIPEGEVTISMDELHEQLDTPPSLKKDFKDFRMRVLDQAQKDITANPDSSLDYEWQPVNKGRKVIAVRFIFDTRKLKEEREAKKKEEELLKKKRLAKLFSISAKCHAAMSALPENEIGTHPIPDAPEVCDVCRKVNLPFPRCQKFKRAEIIE